MSTHHENLRVWKKAHEALPRNLCPDKEVPEGRGYGLAAQIKRAAAAIATNIAEGGARQSRREFAQFVSIARGSASEVIDLLLLSRNLGYLDVQAHADLRDHYDHISRMLTNLFRALRKG